MEEKRLLNLYWTGGFLQADWDDAMRKEASEYCLKLWRDLKSKYVCAKRLPANYYSIRKRVKKGWKDYVKATGENRDLTTLAEQLRSPRRNLVYGSFQHFILKPTGGMYMV